jgi:hypothetical protein
MSDLREMIEIASDAAEKLFQTRGVIMPMYHCVTADHVHFVAPAPHKDKDIGVAMMRLMFKVKHVVRYVFIDEAWIVDQSHTDAAEGAKLEAYAARHGLANHPDRREIVMFLAEDLAGRLSAHRFILRPEHGKPTLAPLKFISGAAEAHGRMVGLLQQGARK